MSIDIERKIQDREKEASTCYQRQYEEYVCIFEFEWEYLCSYVDEEQKAYYDKDYLQNVTPFSSISYRFRHFVS